MYLVGERERSYAVVLIIKSSLFPSLSVIASIDMDTVSIPVSHRFDVLNNVELLQTSKSCSESSWLNAPRTFFGQQTCKYFFKLYCKFCYRECESNCWISFHVQFAIDLDQRWSLVKQFCDCIVQNFELIWCAQNVFSESSLVTHLLCLFFCVDLCCSYLRFRFSHPLFSLT